MESPDRSPPEQTEEIERSELESSEFRFRPLRDEDLRLLHRWLNDPAVVRWWEGADLSWRAIVDRCGSGRWGPVEHWIALLGGEPFGWIQCYCAESEAEDEAYYWKEYVELQKTGGIDYLVGAGAQRGRGLGSAMIRTFVRDIVFARHPEWDFAAAGPFEANAPSCRALEKAGFRRRATLGDEDGPCALMVAERETFSSGFEDAGLARPSGRRSTGA